MIVHVILQLFKTNCVNVPSAIIKKFPFSCVKKKWISVGKFVTFNENYTYLALHSMLQDINHLNPFPKHEHSETGIFVSIFYGAILLNFKVLYLELQSEVHSKFYVCGKYFHLIGTVLSLGKNWY